MEHARAPRNFGPLPGATHRGRRDNPLCGDDVEVAVVLAEGRVLRAGFQGTGCAVAIASASMLTCAVSDRSVAEVQELGQTVGRLLDGDADLAPNLGELAALAGVTRFPVRVQCARLPWLALFAALDGA